VSSWLWSVIIFFSFELSHAEIKYLAKDNGIEALALKFEFELNENQLIVANKSFDLDRFKILISLPSENLENSNANVALTIQGLSLFTGKYTLNLLDSNGTEIWKQDLPTQPVNNGDSPLTDPKLDLPGEIYKIISNGSYFRFCAIKASTKNYFNLCTPEMLVVNKVVKNKESTLIQPIIELNGQAGQLKGHFPLDPFLKVFMVHILTKSGHKLDLRLNNPGVTIDQVYAFDENSDLEVTYQWFNNNKKSSATGQISKGKNFFYTGNHYLVPLRQELKFSNPVPLQNIVSLIDKSDPIMFYGDSISLKYKIGSGHSISAVDVGDTVEQNDDESFLHLTNLKSGLNLKSFRVNQGDTHTKASFELYSHRSKLVNISFFSKVKSAESFSAELTDKTLHSLSVQKSSKPQAWLSWWFDGAIAGISARTDGLLNLNVNFQPGYFQEEALFGLALGARHNYPGAGLYLFTPLLLNKNLILHFESGYIKNKNNLNYMQLNVFWMREESFSWGLAYESILGFEIYSLLANFFFP
jgi:hypothetical protein